jgi:hypothetical protein
MTQGYQQVELLTAAIADETTSAWVDVRGRTHIVLYVSGLGTISSGVLTFEESLPTAQNVWPATASSISTTNAADVSAGASKAVHLTVGAYAFVRVRITTVIGGGGSVTVGLVAT